MNAKNVTVTVEGTTATIKIDISKRLGRSASGKTTVVGTTSGNIEIAPNVYLGVNCYLKD